MAAADGRDPPGFRRRFVVVPRPGRVTAAVEDDYHGMAVTLRHHDGIVIAVEPVIDRAPWSTCPGAVATIRETFAGAALDAVSVRVARIANCTHLHDLAVLAAVHANDARSTVFDIRVSDPVDGLVEAEIRRDDATVLRIAHRDDVMVAPAAIAGTSLFALRDWIATLDPPMREAARLLQWGTIIAHGRAIPLANQSDASRMPPNCYTFQPERRTVARRVGTTIDFSLGAATPLDRFDGERFAAPDRP